jgi:hypothetical protein
MISIIISQEIRHRSSRENDIHLNGAVSTKPNDYKWKMKAK